VVSLTVDDFEDGQQGLNVTQSEILNQEMYRRLFAIQKDKTLETELPVQKSARQKLILKVKKRLHEKPWYYCASGINKGNTRPKSMG